MSLQKQASSSIYGTVIKASVVWFALALMGYEAKIYSWLDWLNNQIPTGMSMPNEVGQGAVMFS
jgi:hypothetical protein